MLALTADHLNRYPTEALTFYLGFHSPEGGGQLTLRLPSRALTVTALQSPPDWPPAALTLHTEGNEHVIRLRLAAAAAEGWQQLTIHTRLHTLPIDHHLLAEARLQSAEGQVLDEAGLQINIIGQAKVLQYLPSIYAGHDFTSRFLMLFESFWTPIRQQIDQIEHYFDPNLTPPHFLPWLASWLGLPDADHLPQDRLRQLIQNALYLYRRRGTRQALQRYLEIYTGGQVVIEEQRARNFVLGGQAALGAEIALGKENRPNAILVRLQLPPDELTRSGQSEAAYCRALEQRIRALIPAHSHLLLTCDFHG